MSTGAQPDDPIPFSLEEANRVIRLPLVDKNMRRLFTIDSGNYDIPYLAGYSADWSPLATAFIYIDRDLQLWSFAGKYVPTKRFLILHELTEKSILDALTGSSGDDLQRLLILLRMTEDDPPYLHAHGVATVLETYAVRIQFGSDGLNAYNKFMQTQVKRADDERIRRVPANLDLTPYQDENDAKLLRQMEARMALAA